jgi:hypothetical protein
MLVYLEQKLAFVHKLCAKIPQYEVYESLFNFSRQVTVEGRADMISYRANVTKNSIPLSGTFYD